MSKPISAWYRGAGVRRFHTLPMLFQDSVGQHSAGVAYLLNYMTRHMGDSVRLHFLLRALFHDLPEFKTGDIPSPTKAALGEDSVEDMEATYMEWMGIEEDLTDTTELTDAPPDWADLIISLADAGDGLIRAAVECRSGNACFEEAYNNYEAYFDSRLAKLMNYDFPDRRSTRTYAQDILNYARRIKNGGPL